MPTATTIELPDTMEEALRLIQDESRAVPVLVFKKSPICPVSFAAEREVNEFLAAADTAAFKFAVIDVIARKPLARGLTAALDIQHESPQALVFKGGVVRWHTSHDGITAETLREAVFGARH